MKDRSFKLSRVPGAPVSDAELLSDLKRAAGTLGSPTVPKKKYAKVGAYDYSTIIRRFGSWNKALRKAGMPDSEIMQPLLDMGFQMADALAAVRRSQDA